MFYASPGQPSSSAIGAQEVSNTACWHGEPAWACTPWHRVEAFQQCQLPYLMAPFRHTSHTPTLVTESYAHIQCIYMEYAESNPPAVHTHSLANTHVRHTHILTQQLRHTNTLAHNWAQAELQIQKCHCWRNFSSCHLLPGIRPESQYVSQQLYEGL